MRWNIRRAMMRWTEMEAELRPAVRAAAELLAKSRGDAARELEQEALCAIWVYLCRQGWRTPANVCLTVAARAMFLADMRARRARARVQVRSPHEIRTLLEGAA